MSVLPAAIARAAFRRSTLAAGVLALLLGPPLTACSAAPRAPARASALKASSPQSLLAVANRIRSTGCDARRSTAPPLRRQSRLDVAAQRLADGATLAQATEGVGYRALSSVSLEITGNLSDEAVGRMLANRFCSQLLDPALRDVGIYRQSGRLWMLAAAPFATPELADPRKVAAQVDALVNRARAATRRCGARLFPPAPPLKPSARLGEAALGHSRDMAAHSYLEHIGRDGSTPGQRVTRTGYRWRAVGENIAAGPASAREVVAGWLASPEHCANIMDPDFSDTAVAYVVEPRSRMGVYWTQDFAAPQQRPSSRGTSPRPGHSAR